jgi:hypothetical protein
MRTKEAKVIDRERRMLSPRSQPRRDLASITVRVAPMKVEALIVPDYGRHWRPPSAPMRISRRRSAQL